MRALLLVLSLSLPGSALASGGGSWFDHVGLSRGIQQIRVDTPMLAKDLSAAILPTNSSCQISVLENLGWKVTRAGEGTRVITNAGTPCEHASLDDVRAEGGLSLQIPANMDDVAIQTALMPILGSSPSLCAYKFKVRAAAAKAMNALDRNHGFEFYDRGWPYIRLFRPDYWTQGCRTNGTASCFSPAVKNHEALAEFTKGRIATDCALGLQAAEYLTLQYLFGEAGIDTRFSSDEIVLAPWEVIHKTNSATWGSLTNGDSVVDTNATQTSRLGAQAFAGLSGYIGNVYGEAYLDTPIDRGENYETVSMSLLAAAELKARGGFDHFNRQNVRIYQLGRALWPELESLALTTQNPDTLNVSESVRAAFRELQSILASPVYRDFKVWVHPLGTLSFGEHLVRQLKLNPRTPYAITLYPSRMNRGIFLRYVNAQLASCNR